MKKFLICTPGRTASSSLFNYIESSLWECSNSVAAVDRGAYTSDEFNKFNKSEYAAFTMFNGFKLPHVLKEIDTQEWCLILLTRKNIADWLLSMISIHSTNEWHPGKGYILDSFITSKEEFLYTYWGFKCWEKRVYNNANTFNFGKIIDIDFDDLIKDWHAAGQKINNWNWQIDESKMQLGMTTSWKAVKNIDEVLSWLPDEEVQLKEQIKGSL